MNLSPRREPLTAGPTARPGPVSPREAARFEIGPDHRRAAPRPRTDDSQTPPGHDDRIEFQPGDLGQVVGQLTGDSYAHHTARPPVRYDFRTRFAAAWGREGGYVATAAECLAAIGQFARAGSGGPGR